MGAESHAQIRQYSVSDTIIGRSVGDVFQLDESSTPGAAANDGWPDPAATTGALFRRRTSPVPGTAITRSKEGGPSSATVMVRENTAWGLPGYRGSLALLLGDHPVFPLQSEKTNAL